jgi:hypothetical protein
VDHELETRLRGFKKVEPFKGVYSCPSSSADVPDAQEATLAILHFRDAYRYNDDAKPINESEALAKAMEILTARGSGPRSNQNMLVFLAADLEGSISLQNTAREYLAWRAIQKEQASLKLGSDQINEVDAHVRTKDDSIKLQIIEAYCWVLCPVSEVEGDNKHQIKFDALRLRSNDENLVLKTGKILKENGFLIDNWGPASLSLELDKLLWGQDGGVKIKTLWESLCSYCYLPRLANYLVLEGAIRLGVKNSDFAYADGVKGGGQYQGLKLNANLAYLDPSGYLVKSEVAQKQLGEEAAGESSPIGGKINEPGGAPTGSAPGSRDSSPIPPAARPTRFNLEAILSPLRLLNELKTISDEILELIEQSAGHEGIKISLEVQATCPGGFDEQTQKSVEENCQSLRIKFHRFED